VREIYNGSAEEMCVEAAARGFVRRPSVPEIALNA